MLWINTALTVLDTITSTFFSAWNLSESFWFFLCNDTNVKVTWKPKGSRLRLVVHHLKWQVLEWRSVGVIILAAYYEVVFEVADSFAFAGHSLTSSPRRHVISPCSSLWVRITIRINKDHGSSGSLLLNMDWLQDSRNWIIKPYFRWPWKIGPG